MSSVENKLRIDQGNDHATHCKIDASSSAGNHSLVNKLINVAALRRDSSDSDQGSLEAHNESTYADNAEPMNCDSPSAELQEDLSGDTVLTPEALVRSSQDHTPTAPSII